MEAIVPEYDISLAPPRTAADTWLQRGVAQPFNPRLAEHRKRVPYALPLPNVIDERWEPGAHTESVSHQCWGSVLLEVLDELFGGVSVVRRVAKAFVDDEGI
jgi:hypothetical protein